MMQESCNRGAGGASVSAADILAVGSNDNVAGSGKVRKLRKQLILTPQIRAIASLTCTPCNTRLPRRRGGSGIVV